MDENKMDNNKVFYSAFSLGWQLGYTIVIPLVLMAIIGRLADKFLDTSPLFLLGGIILSIFLSVALLYRKIREIIKGI
ncbi:MAG: hypothetical protein A3A80_03620 [Candidatus Terrybacteria bacterium RIFCSPLOWO2_01_FULL_44_24]|uniref:AtpZ/AtpI family protein n=1 Tax=Candidatus Terrybacteria bacterium RIFCSPHIGHO2_01_FULL_43_35 TaxID=1802361 RepID=A0A1G2PDK2_9BACT|nr:MAG: hypothetical protein A2828_00540 [Candidatus Terrybacteria bacterium RIFCSPHIGHO2_01_FULL_43_35]OHA49771.1 MAG: hypothetical protein A3B75_02115 [Candidatus Terrybacteria bacterium RIFCSPHIGHO2_02_FULL_43_14]OHA51593.1 MAG: hypothetical protein A3A80_03620 [Candidatus Terrybacteria bacterium RIFCSPLOWO2_01_FULL_44_24]